MRGRDSGLRLRDILSACEEIESMVAGTDRADFERDTRTRYAILWAIMTIGEAAKHVSDEDKARFPDVSWVGAARMRDRITHGYSLIDVDIAWETATQRCPEIAAALRAGGVWPHSPSSS